MLTSKKELWFIWGTAYSGSTLLGAALQTQPGLGFLGELMHWFGDSSTVYCTRCRRYIDECESRSLRNNVRFYQHAAELFPEIEVFISGNKHPSLDFRYGIEPPSDWHWRIIMLSKTPHEFAHSWARHQGQTNDKRLVAWAMRQWADVYLHLAAYVQQLSAAHSRKISVTDVYHLQYESLAEYPAASVSSICSQFDRRFLGGIRERIWRKPPVCQVNGNRAVMAQFDEDETFFTEVDPKYEGKMGLVFLDQAWKGDRQFIKLAIREYVLQAEKLDAAMEVLGYEQRSAHFEQELRNL
jgi:hypothetical protein